VEGVGRIRRTVGQHARYAHFDAQSDADAHNLVVALETGYYQFCIDNSLSRFASKVVSLYVSSYKRDEWEKYVEELTESDGRMSNVTVS
jgi:hypothetical protein